MKTIKEEFASITGAWIETTFNGCTDVTILFASITGAWIETAQNELDKTYHIIRVHHGRVD